MTRQEVFEKANYMVEKHGPKGIANAFRGNYNVDRKNQSGRVTGMSAAEKDEIYELLGELMKITMEDRMLIRDLKTDISQYSDRQTKDWQKAAGLIIFLLTDLPLKVKKDGKIVDSEYCWYQFRDRYLRGKADDIIDTNLLGTMMEADTAVVHTDKVRSDSLEGMLDKLHQVILPYIIYDIGGRTDFKTIDDAKILGSKLYCDLCANLKTNINKTKDYYTYCDQRSIHPTLLNRLRSIKTSIAFYKERFDINGQKVFSMDDDFWDYHNSRDSEKRLPGDKGYTKPIKAQVKNVNDRKMFEELFEHERMGTFSLDKAREKSPYVKDSLEDSYPFQKQQYNEDLADIIVDSLFNYEGSKSEKVRYKEAYIIVGFINYLQENYSAGVTGPYDDAALKMECMTDINKIMQSYITDNEDKIKAIPKTTCFGLREFKDIRMGWTERILKASKDIGVETKNAENIFMDILSTTKISTILKDYGYDIDGWYRDNCKSDLGMEK